VSSLGGSASRCSLLNPATLARAGHVAYRARRENHRLREAGRGSLTANGAHDPPAVPDDDRVPRGPCRSGHAGLTRLQGQVRAVPADEAVGDVDRVDAELAQVLCRYR
jgi:hypothetical protein